MSSARMPHTERNWRVIVPDLQQTINHERAAAQEWKKVAESRLTYLQHIDKALTIMIEEAARVERVFNTDAPDVALAEAPVGASGEEVFRFVRTKVSALVSFTGHLAREAVSAEQALADVFGLANDALTTSRPQTDTAPPRSESSFDPGMWGFVSEGVSDLIQVRALSDSDETDSYDEANDTSVVPYAQHPQSQAATPSGLLDFLNEPV